MFHKGKKVWKGVYCTPFIETANGYSGVSEINGKNYKTVLMVKIKPNAIRRCKDKSIIGLLMGQMMKYSHLGYYIKVNDWLINYNINYILKILIK